jgi:hypothetical protein
MPPPAGSSANFVAVALPDWSARTLGTFSGIVIV